MRVLVVLLSAIFVIALPLKSSAQTHPDAIRVFIDCNSDCDMNFIKTEVNFADFVPDRFTANVYILITFQPTGSGGREIKLQFEGFEIFKGMSDTLKFNRDALDTDDEFRKELIIYLKLGLSRFAARTSIADQMEISSSHDKDGKSINSLTNKKDKWRFWVFNLGADGNYNNNDNSRNYRVTGRIGASKVTEKIKLNINSSFSSSELRIKYDGDISRFPNNSKILNVDVVRSLNDHWSVGGSSWAEQSTFNNYRYRLTAQPALEYSFFKYSEAVKKSITLYYQAGPIYNNYLDSGYYDVPAHLLFQQMLSLDMGFIQKWGNLSFSTGFNNFLNNFKRDSTRYSGFSVNSISISGNVDIRIVKGLTFNIYFYSNFIKGIYPNIPRKNFTRDDLLTNTRVVPSEKFIYMNFGINYRFGSIYNNVVNPRFNGR